MGYLTDRTLTPERMDAPDVSDAELRRSLRFIRRVNRYLGGTGAVLACFKRWSRSWQPGQRVRILDVATGSGDIPLALARWAEARGHNVHITAVDLHPRTLKVAAEHTADHPRISLVRADAIDLPFLPNSFDYTISSMFLHHLPDIEVLTVLAAMDRLALRGMVWNDLTRSAWAHGWSVLLTLGSEPIVRHDARVSVRAGFTRREAIELRNRLSLGHLAYRGHWGGRFTLAGER